MFSNDLEREIAESLMKELRKFDVNSKAAEQLEKTLSGEDKGNSFGYVMSITTAIERGLTELEKHDKNNAIFGWWWWYYHQEYYEKMD